MFCFFDEYQLKCLEGQQKKDIKGKNRIFHPDILNAITSCNCRLGPFLLLLFR